MEIINAERDGRVFAITVPQAVINTQGREAIPAYVEAQVDAQLDAEFAALEALTAPAALPAPADTDLED